jgi:hypothetical protein
MMPSPSEIINQRLAEKGFISDSTQRLPTPAENPNLYMEILQMLEGEIRHHANTRTEWKAETFWRRTTEQELCKWQQACRTMCLFMDQQQKKHATIVQELKGVTAGFTQLEQASYSVLIKSSI